MANTTRSKKLAWLKPFVYFYIVFAAVYTVLILFGSSFLMKWGAKRNIFEKIYAFFLFHPFNESKSLWMILANAFIWSLMIYAVGVYSVKLLRSRRSNSL